jgi:hypothetical protein
MSEAWGFLVTDHLPFVASTVVLGLGEDQLVLFFDCCFLALEINAHFCRLCVLLVVVVCHQLLFRGGVGIGDCFNCRF